MALQAKTGAATICASALRVDVRATAPEYRINRARAENPGLAAARRAQGADFYDLARLSTKMRLKAF
jgi:hypothetical protein